MKLKNRLFLIIPFVIIAILGWYFLRPKPISVSTVRVERGLIEQKISASGKIAVEKEVSLSFRTNGKVAWIGPKVSEPVRKGQTIASLDKRELEIILSQKEAVLRSAQSDLEKVLDDIRLFQYGNPQFQGETQTQKNLRERAEAQVSQAHEAVLAAKEAVKNADLTAPISGTLVEKNTEVGQNTTANVTVFKVADLSSLLFIGDIDETDIGQLRIEQKTKIILDAYPDKEIQGEVTRIHPQTQTTQTGASVIKTEIKILDGNISLLAGLSGDAEITIEKRENVLTLPTASVFEEGDKEYVFVIENSKAKKREVVTGLSLEDKVEIRAGVLEGDVVVSSKIERVKEEARIKSEG